MGWWITTPSRSSGRRSIATSRRSRPCQCAKLEGWPLDRQLAYWINTYNAIVLRTVYPIRGKAAEADFLEKNEFRMVFHDFDWRLNDLTGR